MTRWRGLLVSVRDASEVAAALAGGATIIDVKDPRQGSLGAATPDTIAAITRAVAGRVPVTCAAGELTDATAERLSAFFAAVVACPPAAVKLGLAGMAERAWAAAWREALAAAPAPSERVAVAYADWRRVSAPEPSAIVAVGAAIGCSVFLVDTADKRGPGLCTACSADDLARWIEQARAAGMQVALAGKIALDEIPTIRRFAPDVVALRSAVCSNGRTGSVDAALVRRAAALLDPSENWCRETA